ncbi:MAG TPA: putative O-glycosylation ligase, exosortase A system-associated [Sphingomonadaceae bacterium]|nr:putative O-glycosylation ligase, exosortase A system-associated [Sphingomonadaceae bacterium]
MLDAFLFLFVMGMLALGLRKPFIWVLAYLYIDIVAPQKIGWTFMQLLPFSLIAFVAAFAGWLLADSKEGSRFTFRQGLILVLLIYCGVTTLTADFPKEALEKWGWVWKAMVFAIFLPLTLRTKLRIEAAALVMVLSVGAIIISGGIKTVFGGGGYGELYFFVNDNTGLYESSIISCVAIAIIPLVLWLAKYGTVYPTDWRVKLIAGGLIFAALLIPVGTEARTGLLCIGVLAVLMLRSVKRRFLYMGLGAVALLLAVPFLPKSFTERMSTIEKHEGDESASTRVAVWMWTLDYVKDHPFGGGFDAYRSNSFTYKTRVTLDMGSGITQTETQDVTDKARAYHSSYFEMLGEQGWPGFILWIWLHVLGLWQMERLRRRYLQRAKLALRPEDAWKGPLATALQQAQIVYLVGSLFVGIAFQPFILMLIGLQCALWSYLNRIDSPAKKRIGRTRRPAPPPASADAVAAEAGALH